MDLSEEGNDFDVRFPFPKMAEADALEIDRFAQRRVIVNGSPRSMMAKMLS